MMTLPKRLAYLIAISTGIVCTNPVLADEPTPDDSFTGAELDFFETSVRPLLARACFECHGETRQESDLRLDSRALLLQGGTSGESAAIPGKPDESIMLHAVKGTGDYEMPPEQPLSDQEIVVLERWIGMGMPWPTEANETPLTMAQRLEIAKREHWSFQPVVAPKIPIVAFETRQPLDSLIRSKWAAQNLTGSKTADRSTLIRRLYFDLIGLPPTYEQVQAFIDDDRPDAYEQLVDSLLASPQYGERWGRHWMDVARYADTSGYAFARDRNYPFAYSFRDYVIRSFNDNLPYDEFIREQLAADQLTENPYSTRLAALGFISVGRRYNNQHEDINDRIDAVTRGFLGLTVACARCHDHKYDAIPTEDYYSLYGVFASTEIPGNLPLIGDLEKVEAQQAFEAELRELQQKKNGFENQLKSERIDHVRDHTSDYLLRVLEREQSPEAKGTGGTTQLHPLFVNQWINFLRNRRDPNDAVFGLWTRLQVPEDEIEERSLGLHSEWKENAPDKINPLVLESFLETPPKTHQELAQLYGSLFDQAIQQWREKGANDQAFSQLPVDWQAICLVLISDQSPARINPQNLNRVLSDQEQQRLQELQNQVAEKQSQRPKSLPRAMVVRDRKSLVNPVVFQRGDPRRRGATVPRQFVALLDEQPQKPFQTGSGRLDLANKIASKDNPLTARVIANRVWMHLFDQSLVESPSDFGIRTARPLQAEVLDYLANYLIEHDWSLKDLQRTILLSSTYRQESQIDPAQASLDLSNEHYWRANRKRLEFEPLRDSLLQVAGKLDNSIGGPAVPLIGDSPTNRRAVYGKIDRQDLPNLLRVFDFASPDQSIASRTNTIVPQQALFLMNSPFSIEIATAISQRAQLDTANLPASIIRLVRSTYSRDPTELETKLFSDFLGQSDNEAQMQDRWHQLAQLLVMANEFTFVD